MRGKVVLITGASKGIGAQTAKLLASRGASVLVNYFSNEEAANQVVSDIEKGGGQALAVRADVRDEEQVQQLVDEAIHAYGRIDGLVNNAAMSFIRKPFLELNWQEFSQKLNDELKAAFQMTQAVLPHMVEKRYGRIVYVATGLAKTPQVPFIAHGTAKAGLITFGQYIAKEFGQYGITANIVSPGLVETDRTANQPQEFKDRMAQMTALKRIANPADVARAIAFYVSDDSRFVTGSNTFVDGGTTMP
ncbi:SDR family NAD(P)-dependent oxidoreductase [Alicyclobacillus sp. SO9]|uniref:SDR family NAD(P)-dependent oxidoreductase n=1 Tax=Alicyclobacillus sp. SO9 TaxID=2665646 RepID=UPI0018E82DBB|nr:SDR family oxidoreductase [Alicyclobacillus sp. SO9]QQE77559.1 SDR family oxidoreductase [Alicyclobacillus sp. SO9]